MQIANATWDSTTAVALSDYDDAMGSAQDIYDTAPDQGQALQVLSAAQQAAWANYEIATASPRQIKIYAEETAWNVYLGAKNNAEVALVSAESSAWVGYSASVALLSSNQISIEAGLQSQFALQVSTALSLWTGSEQTAWNLYLANMANIPKSVRNK